MFILGCDVTSRSVSSKTYCTTDGIHMSSNPFLTVKLQYLSSFVKLLCNISLHNMYLLIMQTQLQSHKIISKSFTNALRFFFLNNKKRKTEYFISNSQSVQYSLSVFSFPNLKWFIYISNIIYFMHIIVNLWCFSTLHMQSPPPYLLCWSFI